MNGVGVLLKRLQRAPLPFPPYDDKVKSWESVSQEMGSHQTLNLLVP